MPCAECKKRGKTWNGGDPVCSFEAGPFSAEGWNCATANAIREICGESSDDHHPNVDWRYCEDQKYATVDVSRLDLPSGYAYALWVTWYKRRGRTDAMWLLTDDEPPRAPTEADCLAILAELSPSPAQV